MTTDDNTTSTTPPQGQPTQEQQQPQRPDKFEFTEDTLKRGQPPGDLEKRKSND